MIADITEEMRRRIPSKSRQSILVFYIASLDKSSLTKLESSSSLSVGVTLFNGVEARKGGPQVISWNCSAGRLDRLRGRLDLD